jgi:hypothetical protein
MTFQHAPIAPAISRTIALGGLAGRALELRELRCFHSVASAGNFGRAARQLNLSPPSLTQQVQKLEQELGATLLIRHRRGVTLTRAGSSLMDRIDVIMGLLSVPLEQAPAPEQTAGTISLALPSESAPFLVPRLLGACGGGAPEAAEIFGLSYAFGPLSVGADAAFIDSQGSAQLTHTSQRHEFAFAVGGAYKIAPGMNLCLEYMYEQKHQGAFNFNTSANGVASGNDIHGQGLTLAAIVNW